IESTFVSSVGRRATVFYQLICDIRARIATKSNACVMRHHAIRSASAPGKARGCKAGGTMPNYRLPTFLKRRRRLWEWFGAACLLAVGLWSAAPAGAIISGRVDGSGHPYAGAIDGSQAPLGGVASGVLISPTVFLTAGHFTSLLERRGVTRGRVTFDSVVNG